MVLDVVMLVVTNSTMLKIPTVPLMESHKKGPKGRNRVENDGTSWGLKENMMNSCWYIHVKNDIDLTYPGLYTGGATPNSTSLLET